MGGTVNVGGEGGAANVRQEEGAADVTGGEACTADIPEGGRGTPSVGERGSSIAGTVGDWGTASVIGEEVVGREVNAANVIRGDEDTVNVVEGEASATDVIEGEGTVWAGLHWHPYT